MCVFSAVTHIEDIRVVPSVNRSQDYASKSSKSDLLRLYYIFLLLLGQHLNCKDPKILHMKL